MAAGEAKSDFWWLVGVLALLGLAWLVTGGPTNPDARIGPFLRPPVPLDTGTTTATYQSPSTGSPPAGRVGYYYAGNQPVPDASHSSYFDQFSFDTGNARYEYQPNQEYIALNYRGQVPVDITGWYLTNGKGERNYDVGGKLVRGQSDAMVIPQVAKLFVSGVASQIMNNLIMPSNGRVIITTGRLPSSSDFPSVMSFQTNSCTGYLGALPDYRIQPYLGSYCPVPRDWPGISQMSSDCYNFIGSLGTCHTPIFERKSDGFTYIDGREDRLTSPCRDFVKTNYNYNGCLANFSVQSDFYKPEWRVFLNRSWELWAAERETITLYDKNNKIVAQTKY